MVDKALPATHAPTKRVPSRWAISSQPLSNTWLPEVSSLCLSIVSFAVIGVVVFIYDDHAAPSLPQGISLNAIVSVLATISKSALIFVVAACISQLKWPWYRVQRRLNDLQLLDDASRGPLGSVQLLTTRLVWSSASVGALITLLALALDPFFQQLIAYPIKEVYTSSTSASARRATSFKTKAYDDSFTAAMNAGIWSQPPMQTPNCPTGNCTWSDFTSVVWCSKCEDVTQGSVLQDCDLEALNTAIKDGGRGEIPCRVKFADGGVLKMPVNVTLRDGSPYSLSCIHQVVAAVSSPLVPTNATWNDPTDYGDYFNATGTHLGIENPVLAMGYASLNLGPGDSADTALPFTLKSAQECVIDICFADYAVSVSKGLSTVSTIRTQHPAHFQRKLPILWPSDLIEVDTTYHCWRQPDVPESDLDLQSIYDYHWNATSDTAFCGVWVDTKGRGFCVQVGNGACPDMNWAEAISTRLATSMPHEYIWYPDGSVRNGDSFENDVMRRVLPGGMEVGSLENVTRNVAASLTNLAIAEAIVNAQPVDPRIYERLNLLYGHAGASVTHVKARFKWMILPAMLELTALGLLIATMRNTKKNAAPMWKESILALLSHGLKEEFTGFEARRGRVMTVAEMEAQAEKTAVCLRMTEKGYGFARNADTEQQSAASTPPS